MTRASEGPGVRAVVAGILVVVGCTTVASPGPRGPTVPGSTPAPATSPVQQTAPAVGVRGRDWGAAAVVEQPPGNTEATLTPYQGPGSLGHPQHYQGGQADLLDVAASPDLLVAVGYLARD